MCPLRVSRWPCVSPTFLQAAYVPLESVSLALGVALLVLDVTQLALNGLTHLVESLRLVLQRVHVILFALWCQAE